MSENYLLLDIMTNLIKSLQDVPRSPQAFFNQDQDLIWFLLKMLLFHQTTADDILWPLLLSPTRPGLARYITNQILHVTYFLFDVYNIITGSTI